MCGGDIVGKRRSREDSEPFGDDDEDEQGRTVVFDLGGRLDLPEDFSMQAIRLVSPDELAAAARNASAMVGLRALVDWVGKGRRLDDDGELEADEQADLAARLGLEPEEWLDADDEFTSGPYATQVSLLTEWAAVAGFVYQKGYKLFRRASGHDMDADPLAAWWSAFEAVLELGVIDLDGNGPPWGDTVDAAIPDLIVLANTGAAPLTLSEVVERLCSEEQELLTFTSDDGIDALDLAQAIAEDARVMVEKLDELDVVSLEAEVLVGTPLGAWAALLLLQEDGFDVPLVVE